MTERLYYSDAYVREFDATVTAVADDGRRVFLDRTAFYPTSGGQPFDTGMLGERRVVDVIDEGARIAHVLDAPLMQTTGTIHGRVDWPRRFDHMQQHTGQHLLSAVLDDAFGWKTVSVHFGTEVSTLDVDANGIDQERLVEAELRTNVIIWENRPVRVSFEDSATALGLRKPPDRAGEIRVVSIDDTDRSACGGTHVRATSEIGALLLRRTERVKQGTRVEFVCGSRALSRARADFRGLSQVAEALTCAPAEAASVLDARLAAARESESARRKVERELDGYRARERHAAAAPDARGVRRVVERCERGMLDDIRGLAHAVCALPRAAFIGAIADSGSLLVGTYEDSGLEAGTVLKRVLMAAGGRGGGSPRMAQGTVAPPQLEAVVQTIAAEWDRVG